MQALNIIAAVGANGGMGLKGGLPNWRLPDDLRRFAHITKGKIVIMGRKTFASLPVLLYDRINLVLTRERAMWGYRWQTQDYQRDYMECDTDLSILGGITRPIWLAEAADAQPSDILNGLRGIICDADRLWNLPFVIGGRVVFAQALPVTALIFLTVVGRDVEADVFFPKLARDTWHIIASDAQPSDAQPSDAQPSDVPDSAVNYILIHTSLCYMNMDRQHWRLAEAVLPPGLFD